MTDASFDMQKWAAWLAETTSDLTDSDRRWLALFAYRQVLWGRQILKSAHSTGNALPQLSLRMPQPQDEHFWREVRIFAEMVVDGSPLWHRAPTTRDELWVAGLVDTASDDDGKDRE